MLAPYCFFQAAHKVNVCASGCVRRVSVISVSRATTGEFSLIDAIHVQAAIAVGGQLVRAIAAIVMSDGAIHAVPLISATTLVTL